MGAHLLCKQPVQSSSLCISTNQGVAQLVAHFFRIEVVEGSSPSTLTNQSMA